MEKSLHNISDNDLFDLADLFKVFGDSTRIRIMYSLFFRSKNVNEISEELEMSQSAISHQLKYLKNQNLVHSVRDGKSIYYSLADEHVKIIVQTALEHVWE